MKKMTAMTKRIVIAMIMAATSICVTSCGSTTGTDTKTEVKETTTTTAVTTTVEPETTTEATTTKEPETTTTTEATTTKEPETTTTEVTTTEPEVTEPAITTMEDNPEGMYPITECCRRIVEEKLGCKVVNISHDESWDMPAATMEDGRICLLSVPVGLYESGESVSLASISVMNFEEVNDGIFWLGVTCN